MILSVSRRTDIPSFYSEWFFKRLKEGFVYTRNPMNPKQVGRLELSPETVDCIVFWTKNPEPMLARLSELEPYPYYFQFTLTSYGADIEANVPHKRDVMIPVFQRLSETIGSKRVIWRYDPILFTKRYTPEYHVKAFRQMAEALRGYTEKCVISFVDTYAKNKKKMQELGAYELPKEELEAFAKELCDIAKENGMAMASCAEQIDLAHCGIKHNACIDKALIEEILGCKLKGAKDKNQRTECGCMESIDVGTYHTCGNGCVYCYANHSEAQVKENLRKYEVHSPILCGKIGEDDKVTERKVTSLKEVQFSLF
ncbi:MAG: DUF1848 domain-containing protein [Lachnospiraceae bacterium]|nr:DUF1848 domain-containing protein [Lachnospiraceae bacterium]